MEERVTALKEKLVNSKILIWGTGEKGRYFTDTFGKNLLISGCTSNLDSECIEGLERLEPIDVCTRKGQYFIIICSNEYEQIKFQLLTESFELGVDFISQDIAIAILKDIKIFLAVGQCEFAVTDYIYKNMPTYMNEYYPFFFDEYKILGIEEKEPRL